MVSYLSVIVVALLVSAIISFCKEKWHEASWRYVQFFMPIALILIAICIILDAKGIE